MTYFEQALEYLELEMTNEARRYLDYAKAGGSSSEREQAIRLLDALQNGHISDATDFARRYSREEYVKPVFTGEYGYTQLHRKSHNISVADLLADKRYLEALSELKKREAKATPEELYYLGILHDDFGMGMPNDKSKARIYLFTSWTAGYVKAGVRYVMSCMEENEDGGFRFNAEQKKILELAEEKGDLEAEILLFSDEAKQEREGIDFEEAKKMAEELFLRLREWQEIEEIPFLNLFLFEFDSDSDDPEVRERAFNRLLATSEHWDTFYSSIALEAIATCYRDGIYVFQDLEEAKKYFKKVVGLNRSEVCSSAQEFLSGEWQEVPDENFEEWRTGKLLECIRKFSDTFYVSNKLWISAKTTEEFIEASREYSSDEVYETISLIILCATEIAITHFGMTDAESIIESKLRSELSRFREAIEDWEEVLREFASHLKGTKIDWVSEGVKAVGNFITGFVNPIAGGVNSVKNFLDVKKECKERSTSGDRLIQKLQRLENRRVQAEADLKSAFADICLEIEKNVSGEISEKSNSDSKDSQANSLSVFCTSCGAKNPEDANFCHKCGAKIFKNEG